MPYAISETASTFMHKYSHAWQCNDPSRAQYPIRASGHQLHHARIKYTHIMSQPVLQLGINHNRMESHTFPSLPDPLGVRLPPAGRIYSFWMMTALASPALAIVALSSFNCACGKAVMRLYVRGESGRDARMKRLISPTV